LARLSCLLLLLARSLDFFLLGVEIPSSMFLLEWVLIDAGRGSHLHEEITLFSPSFSQSFLLFLNYYMRLNFLGNRWRHWLGLGSSCLIVLVNIEPDDGERKDAKEEAAETSDGIVPATVLEKV
jgi:hypothetical protein